jgi:hypothetical protein
LPGPVRADSDCDLGIKLLYSLMLEPFNIF